MGYLDLISNTFKYSGEDNYGRYVWHRLSNTGQHCMFPSLSHVYISERISQYIKVADECLANISHAVIPGSFMVDFIPFCAYSLCYDYLGYITNMNR